MILIPQLCGNYFICLIWHQNWNKTKSESVEETGVILQSSGKVKSKEKDLLVRWGYSWTAPMRSCMHTHAWGPSFLHAHKCTFMHSSNIRILGLSAHVCRLIRASSDRKQGVSQGEIFVMEIWTAGVGKQSWRLRDDILYTWANRQWGITNQNLKSENKGVHIHITAKKL